MINKLNPFHVKISGCGGSKVAENMILTAAHCLFDEKKKIILKEYSIGNIISASVKESYLISLEVINVFMHSSYRKYSSSCSKYDHCTEAL